MTDIKLESKEIVKHSSIYMLGAILNRVIGFLMIPIYTKFLVPADYGIIQLLGLTTEIIGMVISVGISAAMYRIYFDYHSEKDRNEVLSTAILTFGIAALASLSVISLLSNTLAAKILDSPSYYYFFLLSFSSLWLNTMVEMGYSYLRIQQKSIQYLIYSLSKLLVSLFLNIYLVAVVRLGILGILLSTLLTSLAFSIIIVLPLLIKIGIRYSYEKSIRMLKYGAPLIPTNLAAFMVHASDRFFIKYFTGLADTGIYSLAYRFGNLPNEIISAPFMQIWEVRYLKSYKEIDAGKLFGKLFTYLCFLLVFVGLMISALIREVLMIISNASYWGASEIVPVIIIAYIIFSFQYFFNMGISFAKKTMYFAYINASNAILNVILNLILIKQYGMWGAAFATVICFTFKVSITFIISNRMYKIELETIRILKIVLAALGIYLLCSNIHYYPPILALLVKAGIVCVFPLIIYLLRFYTVEEKNAIWTFFRSPQYAISRIFGR